MRSGLTDNGQPVSSPILFHEPTLGGTEIAVQPKVRVFMTPEPVLAKTAQPPLEKLLAKPNAEVENTNTAALLGPPCSAGTADHSPAFQRRCVVARTRVPKGRLNGHIIFQPFLWNLSGGASFPALKRRAIIVCPFGAGIVTAVSSKFGLKPVKWLKENGIRRFSLVFDGQKWGWGRRASFSTVKNRDGVSGREF